MKILIGIPTNRDKNKCLGKFLTGLKEMIDSIKRQEWWTVTEFSSQFSRITVLFTDDSPEDYTELTDSLEDKGYAVHRLKQDPKFNIFQRIAHAKNYLAQYALKEGYDYLLLMDSDLIPPEYALDRLVSHVKKDPSLMVVSGGTPVMKQKQVGNKILMQAMVPAYLYIDEESEKLDIHRMVRMVSLEDILPSGRLINALVTQCGVCTFFNTKVFEKIQLRYDPKHPESSISTNMGIDCHAESIPIYFDSAILVKHMGVAGISGVSEK